MTTIELGGGSVVLYNSVKEMPIALFRDLQKYLLQSSGIGSTIADFDRHFQKLHELIAAEKLAEAIEEKENLRFNFFSVVNGINWKNLAMMCLVHSINGKPVDNGNQEGTWQQLESMGMNWGKAEDILNDVKKNLTPN